MTACHRIDGDALLLAVRLTPRASADRVGGQWTDEKGQSWLAATVTAPPDKGRANAALVALLAKTLDCPKSTISLEAGDTSRLKRLRIVRADQALADRVARIAES